MPLKDVAPKRNSNFKIFLNPQTRLFATLSPPTERQPINKAPPNQNQQQIQARSNAIHKHKKRIQRRRPERSHRPMRSVSALNGGERMAGMHK